MRFRGYRRMNTNAGRRAKGYTQNGYRIQYGRSRVPLL